jgi:TPR repeat protein
LARQLQTNWHWIGLMAMALLYAALVVPTWGDAYLDFGDGNYLYVSERVRQGAMLYRDVLSPQPPVHTIVGAAALGFGETFLGRGLWGVRLYSLLLHLATAWLVALLAGRIAAERLGWRGGQWASFGAALLYLAIPTTFWWTRGYQTHPTLAFLMLGAAWLILLGRPLALAGAGVLAALGLMTSMTSAPYVAYMAGWVVLRRTRRALWFLLPCAACAAAIGGWFEATTGHYLDNVVHNQVGSFPREEITGQPLWRYVLWKLFWQGEKIIGRELPFLLAGVAGLAWWLGRTIPAALAKQPTLPCWDFLPLFTLGWWGSIVFVAKGATADYIFTLGEPWVCLWGGVAVGAAAQAIAKARSGRRWRIAKSGLAALGLFAALAALQWGLFVREVSLERQDELGAEDVQRVAAIVERYSEPGEAILAPPFYAFIAGRRVAGEYAEIFLWTIKYINERQLPDVPEGEGVAKALELAGMLERREIPLVLLDLNQTGRIPEIARALDENYCLLFRQDSHTLNTPLRFLVPKPESGDCDDALIGDASPCAERADRHGSSARLPAGTPFAFPVGAILRTRPPMTTSPKSPRKPRRANSATTTPTDRTKKAPAKKAATSGKKSADARGKGRAKQVAPNAGARSRAVAPEGSPEEIADLQRRADAGEPLAMRKLGERCAGGDGVEWDVAAALEWLRRAAEAGDTEAMQTLARYLNAGVGGKRDAASAKRLGKRAERTLRERAEAGDAEAMKDLGNALADGLPGVPRNPNVAAIWLEKAIELGNKCATCGLGSLLDDPDALLPQDERIAELQGRAARDGCGCGMAFYGIFRLRGRGVPADPRSGVQWLLKAAAQNKAAAMNLLGDLCRASDGPGLKPADALEWYLRAAKKRDVAALDNLGDLYFEGEGVERDWTQAAYWYRRAALMGNASGMVHHANMLWNGRGVPQDRREAIRWYSEAIRQGHPWGMFNLADCLRDGEGVDMNHAEAAKLFRRAAKLGVTEALVRLGDMARLGEGGRIDFAAAARLYEQAAEAGEPAGMNALGDMLFSGEGPETNEARAVDWFRKAAELGDARAMRNIGVAYHQGRGVDQDYDLAAEWHRKAVALGDASAMNHLGFLHQTGLGARRDPVEAARLYRQSAEMGYAWGACNLAFSHYRGDGVELDHEEARRLFQIAAEADLPAAMYHLGSMWQNGQGGPRDPERAAAWFLRAAQLGHPWAMDAVGNCYHEGQGVDRDYHRAAEWFRRAAENGDADAMQSLANLRQAGRGTAKDLVDAFKWRRRAADQGNIHAMAGLGHMFQQGHGVPPDADQAAFWFREAARRGHPHAIHMIEQMARQRKAAE